MYDKTTNATGIIKEMQDRNKLKNIEKIIKADGLSSKHLIIDECYSNK